MSAKTYLKIPLTLTLPPELNKKLYRLNFPGSIHMAPGKHFSE